MFFKQKKEKNLLQSDWKKSNLKRENEKLNRINNANARKYGIKYIKYVNVNLTRKSHLSWKKSCYHRMRNVLTVEIAFTNTLKATCKCFFWSTLICRVRGRLWCSTLLIPVKSWASSHSDLESTRHTFSHEVSFMNLHCSENIWPRLPNTNPKLQMCVHINQNFLSVYYVSGNHDNLIPKQLWKKHDARHNFKEVKKNLPQLVTKMVSDA